MRFKMGDMVTVTASHAEGRIVGYSVRLEGDGDDPRRVLRQYFVKFAGAPIWVDEDRLRVGAGEPKGLWARRP